MKSSARHEGRTGCQWEYLPHDLPPESATMYYFRAWRDDGTDAAIHEILRAQVRERAGRTEDSSAVIVDTQSVHVSVNVPAATTGKDANKKVPGRKRGIVTDPPVVAGAFGAQSPACDGFAAAGGGGALVAGGACAAASSGSSAAVTMAKPSIRMDMHASHCPNPEQRSARRRGSLSAGAGEAE